MVGGGGDGKVAKGHPTSIYAYLWLVSQMCQTSMGTQVVFNWLCLLSMKNKLHSYELPHDCLAINLATFVAFGVSWEVILNVSS